MKEILRCLLSSSAPGVPDTHYVGNVLGGRVISVDNGNHHGMVVIGISMGPQRLCTVEGVLLEIIRFLN